MAYDVTNYGLIRDQLVSNHKTFLDNNRAQLLDDAFNLALVELVSYSQALDLTLYLKNEQQYVPWTSVLSELNYIDTMLYNFAEFANWKVCPPVFSILDRIETIIFELELHDEYCDAILQLRRIQRNSNRSAFDHL